MENRNGQAETKRPDAVKAAQAAFDRFLSLLRSLPPDMAAPLWQTAQAQASAALIR
jgi:hypothetical protein